nr:hypothetical protein [Tanacetum cinerariifolium]
MSTQQDIYTAGSENRPPMLKKDNYVSWSSSLLRYTKSKPNGKLLVNSIKNGPYVRRIIHKPGDANSVPPIVESTREQTDDELTDQEAKQMEADGHTIQTILMGLPEDIYATVDSCQTDTDNCLCVKQMMKGSTIEAQEKEAKLFNEWEKFKSTEGESIESNQNGLIVVLGIAPQITNQNANQHRNGIVVAALAEGNANKNNGDIDEIEEVNANCILMANLQQASTLHSSMEQSGGAVQQHLATIEETRAHYESLFNNLAVEVEKVNMAVVVQDLMSIMQNNSVVDTSDLQTELDPYNDMQNQIEWLQAYLGDLKGKSTNTHRESDILDPLSQKLQDENVSLEFQPRSNTKNDRVPSASTSSCLKNKEAEVEERHRTLLLSKNKKHISSECNNVKIAIRNAKSEAVCAICKKCLITANHDVCMLNYMNYMNSHGKKQKENVSNVANQIKLKPKARKPNKVGSKERLASPKPSKPRTCLT